MQPTAPVESWTQDAQFLGEWGLILDKLFREPNNSFAGHIIHTLWQLSRELASHPVAKGRIAQVLVSTTDRRSSLQQMGVLLSLIQEFGVNSTFLNDMVLSNQDWLKQLMTLYITKSKSRVFDLAEMFPRCKQDTKELLITTELARQLARVLIDDNGQINMGAVDFWNTRVPLDFPTLPNLYKKQIDVVLHALLNHRSFQQEIMSIRAPHASVREDLLIQLKCRKSTEFSQAISRRAALGALLSYSRQDGGADCFVQSIVIGILQHDPSFILRQLKQLIETGKLAAPGMFRQFPNVNLRWEETFHHSYVYESMPSGEILASKPFITALAIMRCKPRQADDPTMLTTPRDELVRHLNLTQLSQKEKEKALILGLNMMASYFQNHLLQTIITHAKFISDNFLNGVSSRAVVLEAIVRFVSINPQLRPIAMEFRALLQNRLFFHRIQDATQLQTLMSLGISRERLMEGWGNVVYIDAQKSDYRTLGKWEDVAIIFPQLLKEAFVIASAKNPSMDWNATYGIISQLQANPAISVTGFRELALNAAGGTNSYPKQLFLSPYCCFSVVGGFTSVLMEHFFHIDAEQCPIDASDAREALFRLASTLHQKLPPQPTKSHPPFVLCHHKTATGNHTYTLLPYNYTLRSIWCFDARSTESPEETIKRKIATITTNSEEPLGDIQRGFLRDWLLRIYPDDRDKFMAATLEFSEKDICPSKIMENWKRKKRNGNPIENDIPALQIALNQAVEMLAWPFWKGGLMKHVVNEIHDSRFPPEVDRAMAIERLEKALDPRQKQMQETGDVHGLWGMTVHVGAKHIFDTLLEMGFDLEFGEILQPLCHLHGFPSKVFIGDLNYTLQTGHRELWIVPNYGNKDQPVGFAYADGTGYYDVNNIPAPMIEFLYIKRNSSTSSQSSGPMSSFYSKPSGMDEDMFPSLRIS